MFHTKVVHKIKTHTLCTITFFSRKLHRLCNNVEKYCNAGQATDENMQHAHCKATNIHSQYVIHIAFPLQHWLHDCPSVFHCTHTACLVAVNLKLLKYSMI